MDNQQQIEENNKLWDVKRAGERLLWRFSLDKPFKPNADDKLALKSVLAWINKQSSGVLERHNCFAKLYLLQLVGLIRENKTTVFNDVVFSELSHQLSKPLDLFYKAFYEDLASNQLNRLTKDNITTKEGEAVIMDYKRFKETFPLETVVSKLNEQMIATLHRRS